MKKQGFICLVFDKVSGLCKIHFSYDPEQDFKELCQYAAENSPAPHEFYLIDAFPGTEKSYHGICDTFTDEYIDGLWFRLTIQDYVEFQKMIFKIPAPE